MNAYTYVFCSRYKNEIATEQKGFYFFLFVLIIVFCIVFRLMKKKKEYKKRRLDKVKQQSLMKSVYNDDPKRQD